ncbi:MAG: hypothetical protein DWQ47_16580 [Acidobacteria bacterium]|nr:MAG: hypothetical protein DWQ32_03980 [Acidobacteriota bacterium]REK02336.1 MAG: hypothetical protein DWQ38_08160 [Acidobacteriota bacterium]REK13862.1 MAG: hypothetical protein DWQ43_09670 [Acidobacteriota bacterium]REK41857.1 MAG: hypothetical protein DWQ47_16580 [Acidobacteriota bacterium]
MANEESITITEKDAEGNETTIEITTSKADDIDLDGDGEAESLVEEVVEALFDVEIGDSEGSSDHSVDEPAEFDSSSEDPAAPDLEAAAFDSGTYDLDSLGIDAEVPDAGQGSETAFAESTGYSELDAQAEMEEMEQNMHGESAREAQEAADAFVEEGDYEAAAQAREVAEAEAAAAGDESMLSGASSDELETAAAKQAEAESLQQQQAEHAREGDYEAALEDSRAAEQAVEDSDFAAGGPDHSGQAEAERGEMEWAVWEQDIADDNARDAAAYAAEGDTDAAEVYADAAVDAQEAADHHGDLGEHGGDVSVYDPTSDVASGGVYDPSTAQADADFDSGIDAADTSIDTTPDFTE